MKLLKHLHWILYPIFFLGCARQTSPTGGPKDTIPPTLIPALSHPKNGQVNFKGKTIELTFSESILLNNPKEQLIITPHLPKDPVVKAKKNQLILTFENELEPNTTYAINFREAVQDITEKNPAEMLRLAFSTGPYIDSLSIEGNVFDPLKNKDLKDATVALYQIDTFNIFKHRPSYITKSDTKGKFKLDNIKPGTYFVYGLEDKNKNLIADSKTESYGFLRDSIILNKNINNIKLPLVRLDSRPLKMTSARPYGTYFSIKTTKSLTAYTLSPSERIRLTSQLADDGSNIKVYNTIGNRDSVSVRFHATDSIKNSIDTTFYIKFAQREVTPEKFDMKLDDFQVLASKGTIRGKINFTKPVTSVNFDSIYYVIDSLHQIHFTPNNLTWDSLINQVSFEKSFDKNLVTKAPPTNQAAQPPIQKSSTKQKNKPPSIQNQLYLGHAAFISIEHDSSKRITEPIPAIQFEDTGLIIVEIQTKIPHYFVQLLTKDFIVLATKRNTPKFQFEDLKPADYQIRLVIDKNNDGEWNPGNYHAHEEPEQMVYYLNEKRYPVVTLKANWELGPLLIKH